jgi:hypothetical protein
MFISLNVEPEAQIAALDRLRAELEAKDVPVKEGSFRPSDTRPALGTTADCS